MINTKKIYKIRIVFNCVNSSIPQANTFYAIREMVIKSKLPFEPAKINKLWPRMVYGPSLAKNQTAMREYLDIYLQESVPVEQVSMALKEVAPQGLEIMDVQRVPYPMPSVQNLCSAIRYRIKGNFDKYCPIQTIEEFVRSEKKEISYQTESGLSFCINFEPYLVKVETLSASEINITLQKVLEKWIKPEWIIASWLGIPILGQEDDLNLKEIECIREALFWKDSQGELHLI